MWRHIASNALTFMILTLFLVAGLVGWGTKQFDGTGPLEEAICLQVASGSNMRRVSNQLADQGAITSPAIFRIGADYADKATQLKAGSFLLPQGASMSEILDAVTRGGASTCGTEVVYRIGVTRTQVQVRELDPATNRFVEVAAFDPTTEAEPAAYLEVREAADTRYRVAVAEGVTSWQVKTVLNGLSVLTGEVAETPAEGSLSPDSYEFTPGDDVAGILDEMARRQERVRMKLQTDPTVIYGVTRGEGVLGRGLRQSELRRETPWNTYVIEGLPPTPIANPGRAAIEAALDPDGSEYIFFVADGTGGHAFAVTLEDHNRNVAAWRAIEAERAGN